MTSRHPEPGAVTPQARRLQKIENFPNLDRLLLPGDKPNEPTGRYYAELKFGRKQFRRSLQTSATSLRKLISTQVR